jgi:hypothetical protein
MHLGEVGIRCQDIPDPELLHYDEACQISKRNARFVAITQAQPKCSFEPLRSNPLDAQQVAGGGFHDCLAELTREGEAAPRE